MVMNAFNAFLTQTDAEGLKNAGSLISENRTLRSEPPGEAMPARSTCVSILAPRRRESMIWEKALRVVAVLNILTLFAQFAFAGWMLGGDDSAIEIHGFTGLLLVLVTMFQTGVSVGLKAKGRVPSWVVMMNIGLVVAEVLQGICGYNRILWIHVPLAAAILAGMLRQLLWSLGEVAVTVQRT
jgi:hypothetical protein